MKVGVIVIGKPVIIYGFTGPAGEDADGQKIGEYGGQARLASAGKLIVEIVADSAEPERVWTGSSGELTNVEGVADAGYRAC